MSRKLGLGSRCPCVIIYVKIIYDLYAFFGAGASDSERAGKCKMHEIYSLALTSTRFAPGTKDTKFMKPLTSGSSHSKSNKIHQGSRPSSVHAPVTAHSADISLLAAVSKIPECSFC